MLLRYRSNAANADLGLSGTDFFVTDLTGGSFSSTSEGNITEVNVTQGTTTRTFDARVSSGPSVLSSFAALRDSGNGAVTVNNNFSNLTTVGFLDSGGTFRAGGDTNIPTNALVLVSTSANASGNRTRNTFADVRASLGLTVTNQPLYDEDGVQDDSGNLIVLRFGTTVNWSLIGVGQRTTATGPSGENHTVYIIVPETASAAPANGTAFTVGQYTSPASGVGTGSLGFYTDGGYFKTTIDS